MMISLYRFFGGIAFLLLATTFVPGWPLKGPAFNVVLVVFLAVAGAALLLGY